MRIANIIRQFSKTINFFTFIPLPSQNDTDMGLERIAVWAPWAGLVIGACVIIIYSIASLVFPPIVAAGCVLSAWVLLTGGMHLDGLADCCDGFTAPVETTRRLEIMRDPHIGAFAVIGITLVLLLKYCMIYVVITSSWPALEIIDVNLPFGLLFAPVAARWLVLWAARAPASQASGLGVTFARGVTLSQVLTAGILPVILTVIGGITALAAILLAGLGTYMITRIAQAKSGGINGDVLGASIEVSELLIVCVYSSNIIYNL